jgi:hypothetical protein
MPAAVPLVLATLLLAQQPVEPAPGDVSREEMRFLKETMSGLKLYQSPDMTNPLAQTPNPVLGPYNNATGPSRLGATFLWLAGERPVAAASVSIRRRPTSSVYCECTSLWPAALECRRDGTILWTPERVGLLNQRFRQSPSPAEGKPRRLTQMRDLARQFSATFYRTEPEEATPLRLLSTPIYRFASEGDGIVDGALFAFANATDPDVLLLVEAVQEKRDAPSYWRYSLARMTSAKMTVWLDGQEIWSLDNYHRDTPEAKKTGPYIEQRIGTFIPPVDGANEDSK